MKKDDELKFRLPKDEKAAFKRWCETRGKEMSEVLRAYMRRVAK